MRRPFRVVEAFNTGRDYTAAGQRIAFTALNGGLYFRDIDRNLGGFYADIFPAAFSLMERYDASTHSLENRPPEYDLRDCKTAAEMEVRNREFGELERVLREAALSLGPSNQRPHVKIVRLPGMDVRIPSAFNGYGAEVTHLVSRRVEALGDTDYPDELDTALDAVESLVLAHASEGVEVWSARYDRGVATTIETLVNRLT